MRVNDAAVEEDSSGRVCVFQGYATVVTKTATTEKPTDKGQALLSTEWSRLVGEATQTLIGSE